MSRLMYDWSEGMTERSGLIGDFERAPLAVSGPPVPVALPTGGARSTEERVAAGERSSVDVVSYQGANSTDATGIGDRVIQGRLPDGKFGMRIIDSAGRRRVQIGEQDDGKYGVRVWDNTSTLIHDFTTAA